VQGIRRLGAEDCGRRRNNEVERGGRGVDEGTVIGGVLNGRRNPSVPSEKERIGGT
jgi:hypothetical protein